MGCARAVEVEEVAVASRPVMPVGTSSMRSSPAQKRLRCGRFGCGMGSGESAGFRFKKSRVGGSGGWWYKGGENVVAVVKNGRKRGALKASGEE